MLIFSDALSRNGIKPVIPIFDSSIGGSGCLWAIVLMENLSKTFHFRGILVLRSFHEGGAASTRLSGDAKMEFPWKIGFLQKKISGRGRRKVKKLRTIARMFVSLNARADQADKLHNTKCGRGHAAVYTRQLSGVCDRIIELCDFHLCVNCLRTFEWKIRRKWKLLSNVSMQVNSRPMDYPLNSNNRNTMSVLNSV